MSVRHYALTPGEFYHIYNRGNSKQEIFLDRFDYEHFVLLLLVANGERSYVIRDLKQRDVFKFDPGPQQVAIGAYCLMPNHFHILLTPTVEGGVSKFMQKMATGYSMYFNKKYKRTGSLFEGKFKSQWAEEDRYLKYLFAYIHLNPVKLIDPTWKDQGIRDPTTAFEYATNYKYSSLPDYTGNNRPEGQILSKEFFPGYFPIVAAHREELMSWLMYH